MAALRAAEEALTCANCGTAEVKFSCARCKVAHYCSRTCQKHHWKGGGHKKSCVAQVVEQANDIMGLSHEGTLADQTTKMLELLRGPERVRVVLGLDKSLTTAEVIEEANEVMGLPSFGSLSTQTSRLLDRLKYQINAIAKAAQAAPSKSLAEVEAAAAPNIPKAKRSRLSLLARLATVSPSCGSAAKARSRSSPKLSGPGC